MTDEAERPIIEFQKAEFKRYLEEVKPQALAEIRAAEKIIENLTVKLTGDEDDDKGTIALIAEQYEIKQDAEKRLEFCPAKLEDFTIQALEMHEIIHSRLFISSDEAGKVSDVILGRYSKNFTDDAPLCKIWSNSNLSRKRKDGYIWNPNVCGTMMLMGQEHITEKLFGNKKLLEGGLIPRFLFASAETDLFSVSDNGSVVKT